MRESLVVSERGEITLPSAIRHRFGIAPGDVVILEDRDGEIVFKPAAVLEIESYSEEQIAQWVDEDQLDDQERVRILRAIESRSG